MAKAKQEKPLCVNDLRHAEYYGMQDIFDELYARSRSRENFTDLMDLILKRENILLAYRNIKANHGSGTPGTDNVTIGDIGKMSAEEVVRKVHFIVAGSKHGYRPKPVRRKDIPKPNGSVRKSNSDFRAGTQTDSCKESRHDSEIYDNARTRRGAACESQRFEKNA